MNPQEPTGSAHKPTSKQGIKQPFTHARNNREEGEEYSLIKRKESYAHTKRDYREEGDEGSHGSLEEGALKSSPCSHTNGCSK